MSTNYFSFGASNSIELPDWKTTVHQSQIQTTFNKYLKVVNPIELELREKSSQRSYSILTLKLYASKSIGICVIRQCKKLR